MSREAIYMHFSPWYYFISISMVITCHRLSPGALRVMARVKYAAVFIYGENEVCYSPFMRSRGSVLPWGRGVENGLLMLNDLVSPMERSYKSSQTRVN